MKRKICILISMIFVGLNLVGCNSDTLRETKKENSDDNTASTIKILENLEGIKDVEELFLEQKLVCEYCNENIDNPKIIYNEAGREKLDDTPRCDHGYRFGIDLIYKTTHYIEYTCNKCDKNNSISIDTVRTECEGFTGN